MTRDGGPAFPSACDGFGHDGEPVTTPFPGVSKREWFAGQALKAMSAMICDDWSNATIARACYTLADAMLAEGARK